MVEHQRTSEFTWPQVMAELVRGDDLPGEVTENVVSAMLGGRATDAQIAGFLIALAAKGETTEEILGMRAAMLAVSEPLELPPDTVDIVGVGGAARRQVAAFNVSTMASIVAAAAGASVCKHGNRKASSTSGSFDLLEALGVNIDVDPGVVAQSVADLGLGFAFARAHHPSMRHVGPARAELGVPTVFNVLGPLAHPGRVRRQVLGVADARRARQIADVVADTDVDCVWVVHGHGDIDEISITGPTDVIEIASGTQRTFVLDPTDWGFDVVEPEVVEGGDAHVNKTLAEKIFSGEPSANRDMVVLNAAAGLVVAGVVSDLGAGTEAAGRAVSDGSAAAKLEQLVEYTNR